MKVTREELIYIHKRIWDNVKENVNKGTITNSGELQCIKDSYIIDMINENVVSLNSLRWVYLNSSCVFCALFSAEFCNNCPLHDCVTPESLYQQVLKGSEEACVKIRDLIYYAQIPEYIEI